MYSASKYPEFHKFYKERRSKRPWDWSHNSIGFPPERPGDSDISAHLPFLEFIAGQCSHITEFGTRTAYSTSAFIAGCRGKVISYDLHDNSDIHQLVNWDKQSKLPCKYTFIKGNTLDIPPIQYTELLFVDSLHTYGQVKGELDKHAGQVGKWIVFHDTYSQYTESIDRRGEKGIGPAIEEFLRKNQNWKVVYKVDFNHGLMVIENV